MDFPLHASILRKSAGPLPEWATAVLHDFTIKPQCNALTVPPVVLKYDTQRCVMPSDLDSGRR